MAKNTTKTTTKDRKRLITKIVGTLVTFGVIAAIFFLGGSTTFVNFRNSIIKPAQTDTSDAIRIGIFEPMSGKDSQAGQDEAAGVELAHSLKPTVLDKDVELLYADNRSNMYDAKTAATELIQKKPIFIIGSYGDLLTIVGGDQIKEARIPAITPTATNPLITVNNPYYFTATFSLDRQGEALAYYAVDALGKTSFATVKGSRDDSATALVDRFDSEAKKLAGDSAVVADLTINATNNNFSQTIEQLKSLEVDTVVLAVPSVTAQEFMKQCVAADYIPTFLGDRDWDNQEMYSFLEKNNYIIASFPSVAPAPATETYDLFIDAYYEKYGKNAPEPSGNMAAAFDSYMMAMQSIEDAYSYLRRMDEDKIMASASSEAEGQALVEEYKKALETGIPSSTQIRDAMRKISDFNGASGVLSYDGENEVSKTVTIIHYFKGKKLDPYVVD
ncbi:MAG: ABC transporter substrate-binding protein [Firmicutes bacterium]|nr:ABC transporter substrate-binding protein [Bacillota bacterium]